MSDWVLDKLTEFMVDVEDEAKHRDIDAHWDIPKKTDNGDWYSIIRFTVYNNPPDLGIHVQDGIGSKDKVGG